MFSAPPPALEPSPGDAQRYRGAEAVADAASPPIPAAPISYRKTLNGFSKWTDQGFDTATNPNRCTAGAPFRWAVSLDAPEGVVN